MCSICSKTFKTAKTLSNHTRRFHQEINNDVTSEVVTEMSAIPKLIFPVGIIESFRDKVRQNTSIHLETCGNILGRFNSDCNNYIVTNIIIPEQIVQTDRTELTDQGNVSLVNFNIDNQTITLGILQLNFVPFATYSFFLYSNKNYA